MVFDSIRNDCGTAANPMCKRSLANNTRRPTTTRIADTQASLDPLLTQTTLDHDIATRDVSMCPSIHDVYQCVGVWQCQVPTPRDTYHGHMCLMEAVWMYVKAPCCIRVCMMCQIRVTEAYNAPYHTGCRLYQPIHIFPTNRTPHMCTPRRRDHKQKE